MSLLNKTIGVLNLAYGHSNHLIRFTYVLNPIVYGCKTFHSSLIASAKSKDLNTPQRHLVKRLLTDVDIKTPQVQYDTFPQVIQHLDDRIKKLLTVEYGHEQDVCDAAYRMLLNECGFDVNEKTPETQVLEITVKIWHLRNLYQKQKSKQRFYLLIMKLVDIRRNLLDGIRNYNFENYYKVMTVLNHHHYFKPEVFMTKSPLADNVKEMKIRAYAHSLNIAQKEEEKQNYFNELKEKFLQELKSPQLQKYENITNNKVAIDSKSFG